MSNNDDVGKAAGGIGCLVAVVVGVICLFLWGCPNYKVYSERLAGEAKLAEAESSRQIAVTEAKAKSEAAEMLADAEVKRALGVAKANQIIGESLKNNEAYLRYLWIVGLEAGANRETVYVPTEAGLPILEAGRWARQAVENLPHPKVEEEPKDKNKPEKK